MNANVIKTTTTAATLASALLLAGSAFAKDGPPPGEGFGKAFEVTITNLTKTQNFTPILAATHSADIAFFAPGAPAIDEIAIIAESGNVAPLDELLATVPDLVLDTAINGALLGPGESVTVTVDGHRLYDRLSFAAMLIPTNDTFVALNSAPLPTHTAMFTAYAWDAGSEENDELCTSIPGPPCFGEGSSEADGEGFVHIANGVHGIGDLPAAAYDWNGPVARVVVTRVR
jgi:hypothetical protein